MNAPTPGLRACPAGAAALLDSHGAITVLDLPSLRVLGGLPAEGAVEIVASWSGAALAARHHDGRVRTWLRDGGTSVGSLPVTPARCTALAVADDARSAAVLTQEGEIVAFELGGPDISPRLVGAVAPSVCTWLTGNADLSLLLCGRGGPSIEPVAMLSGSGSGEPVWHASGSDLPVRALAGPQRCWFVTEEGLLGRDRAGGVEHLPGDGGELLAWSADGRQMLVARVESFTGPVRARVRCRVIDEPALEVVAERTVEVDDYMSDRLALGDGPALLSLSLDSTGAPQVAVAPLA